MLNHQTLEVEFNIKWKKIIDEIKNKTWSILNSMWNQLQKNIVHHNLDILYISD